MLDLPAPSDIAISAPQKPRPRLSDSFAAQAAITVGIIQIALASLLYLGWLTVLAYSLSTVLLSSAAVGWIANSQTQLLQRLRRGMRRFEAGAPGRNVNGSTLATGTRLAPGDVTDKVGRLQVQLAF